MAAGGGTSLAEEALPGGPGCCSGEEEAAEAGRSLPDVLRLGKCCWEGVGGVETPSSAPWSGPALVFSRNLSW